MIDPLGLAPHAGQIVAAFAVLMALIVLRRCIAIMITDDDKAEILTRPTHSHYCPRCNDAWGCENDYCTLRKRIDPSVCGCEGEEHMARLDDERYPADKRIAQNGAVR